MEKGKGGAVEGPPKSRTAPSRSEEFLRFHTLESADILLWYSEDVFIDLFWVLAAKMPRVPDLYPLKVYILMLLALVFC